MQVSPRHQAARAYAEAGIPVFPCVRDGKAPATEHGFHDATTDLGQIDAWWATDDYNLALQPNAVGWAVIDIDGEEGEHAWHETEGGPETYEVKTPRGGRHLYYKGELPTSAWREGNDRALGRHIDTRGNGSYVLVPPSTVYGKPYVLLHDRELAAVPGWCTARLAPRDLAARAAVEELDLPGSIERGRHLLTDCLRRGDVAVSGRGGNARTYQLACEMFNLGLTPATIGELLTEEWNPHCIPPWDHDELSTIIANAASYAQNEPGAWAVAPATEVFGQALDKLALTTEPARRSRFYPEDDHEMDNTPPARWLIKDVLQHETTAMLYGPTQSYKSFIALDLGLGTATNTETFGAVPNIRGPVFYAALEGRLDIKRARRKAWRAAHGIEGVTGFYVMVAPMIVFPEEVQEFGDQIKERCKGRKPALIILETVSKMMVGLDATHDAPKFIRFCDSLVEAFGCTVLAVHHTGHDATRGPRDSSAYQAGFDTVLEVKANRAAKAVEVWVRKHKDQEERAAPFTFEGKAIAGSLVFQPTTAEEHNAVTGKDDKFSMKRVGGALQSLHASGQEHAVTTFVLATELCGPEGTEEDVRAAERALKALARGNLGGYCVREGRDLKWFLPAPMTE